MADVSPPASRPVPDFLIVGAAKAGTTALHSYLAQHPAIAVSDPKETFYFTRSEIEHCSQVGGEYALRPIPQTPADYARCFKSAEPAAIRGESCVAYLYFPEAAARIHAANSACKIVLLLRDPAERAFSNYLHHVRDGLEPAAFAVGLERWPARQRAGWWFGFDYLGGSRYGEQLARFQACFPAAQLRVLWYDDFRRAPEQACRAIFDFLGVRADVPIDTRAELNVSIVPRPGWQPLHRALRRAWPLLRRTFGRQRATSLADALRRPTSYRPVLSSEDRATVQRALRSDIERLQELTGRDLQSWLTD